ncbi:GRAM domain-containing protein [Vibrio owensii]|uniref:GRAM domain-containing protein n=1 Tax=Vibrio owensii TaxID=696485 RepID=UPI000597B2A8|nr:GRAM domain-containing protein [Vibrio owensii]
MFKKWMFLICILSLVGCSNRGPMKSGFGPVETSKYIELLERDLVSSNESILVYSESMFTEELYAYSGALILTDQQVIFAEWDNDSYEYRPIYSTLLNDIVEVEQCNPLAATISLIGQVFCVYTDEESVSFATEKYKQFLYLIEKNTRS